MLKTEDASQAVWSAVPRARLLRWTSGSEAHPGGGGGEDGAGRSAAWPGVLNTSRVPLGKVGLQLSPPELTQRRDEGTSDSRGCPVRERDA